MAAMPSFGLKKLAVGVAIAAFALSAATASAKEAWLWACHGPSGQALPELGTRADRGAGGSCQTDTRRQTLTRSTLTPGSAASARSAHFQVPSRVHPRRGQPRTHDGARGRSEVTSPRRRRRRCREAPAVAPPPTGSTTVARTGRAARQRRRQPVRPRGHGRVVPVASSDAHRDEGSATRSPRPAPSAAGFAGVRSDPGRCVLNVQASDVGVGLKSATAFLDDVPVGTESSATHRASSCPPMPGRSTCLRRGRAERQGRAAWLLGHGALDLLVATRSVARRPATRSVTPATGPATRRS